MNKFLSISSLFAVMSLSAACSPDNKASKPVNIYGNAIYVDATKTGAVMPNICDNVNVWEMGRSYYNPKVNNEANVFEFVRYVQFMQCTGGNAERDLFKIPADRTVLDDYDFERLITNCRGVLALGAKPYLKLGNVPLKMSTDPVIGNMGVNVYPPDDYNQYYKYLKDVLQALVDEFGLEEVRSWRFGCLTEYENYDWFYARSKRADDSFEAYCKLYDWTVQALTDVLGEDVFIGAHSMTVTEGGWDERRFIEHVAKGTNWANGKTGTRISALSASFYDTAPGQFTKMSLHQTVSILKEAAAANGLNNLIFGIDEGRILNGTVAGTSNIALYNRTVGHTWQAAYDARIFKQGIDAGLDYFSSWNFLTGGNINGIPIISYHVARHMAKFEGMNRVEGKADIKALDGAEVDCLAGTDGQTVRVMVYNFKNTLNYKRAVDFAIRIQTPWSGSGRVEVKSYRISDDCNFFDEWIKDREELGINNTAFGWSPDDPLLDTSVTLQSNAARQKYNNLKSKYTVCARLLPDTTFEELQDGVLILDERLEGSNVLFLEIKPI